MCIKRNMLHECHLPQEFTDGLTSLPQKSMVVPYCCSVTNFCVSGFLWPHGLQHARLPCPSPSPRFWVGDTIQPCHPLLSPSRPALRLPMVKFKPVVTFLVYIWLCWKIKNFHSSKGEAHQWFWLKAEFGVAIARWQRLHQFQCDCYASLLLALVHHIMNPFKCGLRQRVKFYLPNLILRALFQICKI